MRKGSEAGELDPSRADPAAHAAVRWFAALIAVVYGFAKLNGSQFTILDSELDKPMGEVSGFWLTWYYLGYSWFYGNLIAVVQVAGGLLLTFPKWSVVGALLLLPVAANVVLVGVFYGVDAGGILVGGILLGLLLWILSPHAKRLFHEALLKGVGRKRTVTGWVGRVSLVVGAFLFTFWVAHGNNRHPTHIDGVWIVVDNGGTSELEKVFFERNRSHLVVFKNMDGEYNWHHFEVESDGVVRIWEQWLEKGPLIFEGSVSSDTLEIWLGADGDERTVQLRRERGVLE